MKISLDMEIAFGIGEIEKAAAKFIEQIKGAKVIAFHGAMGAGKTTFISAVVKALGSTDKVSSPTFSIINEYSIPGGRIYHLDLYRLEDEREAVNAGVEECLYSGHLCLVEWPERAEGLFPPETLHCGIDIASDSQRKLKINL